MTALKIEIKAIMSGWGESGAHTTRTSSNIPTLSGVLGLIGNALGVGRTDPRLPSLWEGLEIDILVPNTNTHSPTKLGDFQTFPFPFNEKKSEKKETRGISTRFYDVGAWFCVLIRTKPTSKFSLEEIEGAFRSPQGLLYLGRKNCPLSWISISTGTHEELIASLTGWTLYTSTPHALARQLLIRTDRPGKNRTFQTRTIYVVPIESPSPA